MLCKLFIKGGQGKRDIRIVHSNLANISDIKILVIPY